MYLALQDPQFNWSDLSNAYRAFYEQSPIVPFSFLRPVPPRVVTAVTKGRKPAPSHICTGRCCLVGSGDVFICTESCQLHVCSELYCDQLRHTPERKICELTGRNWELDDGLVFGYDNADPAARREYVDGRSTVYEIEMHELMLQHAPVAHPNDAPPTVAAMKNVASLLQTKSEQSDTAAPRPLIRRKARGGTPPPIIASNSASSSSLPSVAWALSSAPPKKKPRPMTPVESDTDHHALYALAGTYLSKLGVTVDSPLMPRVSHICQRTWDLLVTTRAYKEVEFDYKPEYHVIVMLNQMLQSEIVIGNRSLLVPRIPELGRFFKGPRDFVDPPFNLSTKKFTQCEGMLRRCNRELAMGD